MQLLNGQMSLRLNPCYDTLVLGMFDALAKPRCLRPSSRGAWLCSIAELVERPDDRNRHEEFRFRSSHDHASTRCSLPLALC